MTLLKYEPQWADSATPNHIKTLIVDNYDSPRFHKEVLPYIDQIILSPGPGRPERPEDFGICKQILETTNIPVFGVCLGHQGIGAAHGAKVTYGAEPVHGQIAHIEHTGTSVFAGLPQGLEAVRYHSLVIQEDSLPDDLIPTAWCYSAPLIPQKGPTLVDPEDTVSHFQAVLPMVKTIMGVQHRTLPHHGVQFHPESICTQHGRMMMQNFFEITRHYYATRPTLYGEYDNDRFMYDLPDRLRRLSVVPTSSTDLPPAHGPTITNTNTPTATPATKSPSNFHLLIQALDPTIFPEAEQVFESLFLTGPRSTETSWWLDSARQPHPMSRFSFMGGSRTRGWSEDTCRGGDGGDGDGNRTRDDDGTHSNLTESRQLLLQYSTLHHEIYTRHYNGDDPSSASSTCSSERTSPTTTRTIPTNSFWDWISDLLNDIGQMDTTVLDAQGHPSLDLTDVPFDFMAGLVGYLGYEMKRESLEGYRVPAQQQCSCQAHHHHNHNEPRDSHRDACCSCDCARIPDATFLLATQAVVFDHQERQLYVLGIVDRQHPAAHVATSPRLTQPIGFTSVADCRAWMDHVTTSITAMVKQPSSYSSRRSSVFGVGVPSGGSGGAQDHHHTPYAIKQRQRRQSSASLVSPFKINFTEDEYLDAIRKSLEYIHEGESYEICLTSQFRATIPLEPLLSEETTGEKNEDPTVATDQAFELYKILRRLNPAPFSTFMSYPTNNNNNKENPSVIDRQLILGSSPERFIRLGQKPADEVGDPQHPQKRESSRTVEMKPIKGTVAVAKGCFCSEDEGCSLDMHSEEDSTHGHDDSEDEGEGGEEEEESRIHKAATTATGSSSATTSLRSSLSSERRSRKDLCEDARKREDLRRIETLGSNVKERAENLMVT
ncbi:hypothetical protein DFQ26_007075 [Actinomortierella ambigua]|nr:hypothetical protein DFQ26_007075 [Actinomortierella ambigua]